MTNRESLARNNTKPAGVSKKGCFKGFFNLRDSNIYFSCQNDHLVSKILIEMFFMDFPKFQTRMLQKVTPMADKIFIYHFDLYALGGYRVINIGC